MEHRKQPSTQISQITQIKNADSELKPIAMAESNALISEVEGGLS